MDYMLREWLRYNKIIDLSGMSRMLKLCDQEGAGCVFRRYGCVERMKVHGRRRERIRFYKG